MNIPSITDLDEQNYLKSLKESSHVGNPKSADQGYYARVLRHKYQDCHARLTATAFQILQPGFSSAEFPLTSEQQARQRLFDTLNPPERGTVTKKDWQGILNVMNLLPKL